ncbi:MAG: SPOR domain-containing protein [Paludibacter sp.]|nr:SPOR domain-containing protein [Paludibacter sp.]
MKKILYLTIIFAVLVLQNAYSQAKENIFASMETPEAQTGAKVTFVQDDAIEALLLKKNTATVKGGTVYRVQVFSSNQRTAKNDATSIERQLRTKYPNENIQVNYVSPFWKVRIGEFTSREDASKFIQELRAALPSQQSQMYIVADRNR